MSYPQHRLYLIQLVHLLSRGARHQRGALTPISAWNCQMRKVVVRADHQTIQPWRFVPMRLRKCRLTATHLSSPLKRIVSSINCQRHIIESKQL